MEVNREASPGEAGSLSLGHVQTLLGKELAGGPGPERWCMELNPASDRSQVVFSPGIGTGAWPV